MLQSIDKIEGKTNIVREYSSLPKSQPLGNLDYTMELFLFEGSVKNGTLKIEWDIPAIEETVQIGIWTEGGKLTDYDGVFILSAPAIKFLRKNGISVGRDFTS